MASTMNTSRWLQVAVLATASFFSVGVFSPTSAATFDSAEVNSNNFIAVAAPFGNNQHQLLIIEQVSNKRPCWSESGSNPVKVEPLLLNFDFTGICGRSTDSNGYSLRMSGQDLGLDYLLRIVERDGDLVLLGTPRVNPQAPEIEIGRTKGITEGFEKIVLNPGWRFTRRTYQGKALGHIYLTSDSAPPVAQQSNTSPQPLPPNNSPLPPITQPLPPSNSPLPPSTQPLPPITQPLPPITQPLPPERELIFTKPQPGSTTTEGEIPSISPQTLPSLSPSKSTVPTFVVPTIQQGMPTAPVDANPATNPQNLPSPPPPARQIPGFVVPTN
jgi:hypothetical protein